jgi:hypothetical protein
MIYSLYIAKEHLEGKEPESVDAQTGDHEGGASRRTKPKYVHYSKRVHYRKEEFQPYYKHC